MRQSCIIPYARARLEQTPGSACPNAAGMHACVYDALITHPSPPLSTIRLCWQSQARAVVYQSSVLNDREPVVCLRSALRRCQGGRAGRQATLSLSVPFQMAGLCPHHQFQGERSFRVLFHGCLLNAVVRLYCQLLEWWWWSFCTSTPARQVWMCRDGDGIAYV